MKNNNKHPIQQNEVPLYERVVNRCWKPGCKNVATGQDGSGWEWCEEHFDQEKTGSILHTKRDNYDVEFYQKKAKEIIHLTQQQVIRDIVDMKLDGMFKYVKLDDIINYAKEKNIKL